MERNEHHANLVRQVLDGDGAAFEKLYEETYRGVLFHAKKILKNEADVEDAVSETYLRAYQNLSKLADPALFQAWVNRIAANYAMNSLRNDHFRESPSMDDEFFFYEPTAPDAETPDKVLDQKGTEEIMGKIINALPDVQKMTVILYYYDEMSVSDIAKTMECSTGTVKSRLNYARRNIEQAVREEEKRGVKLYSVSPALLAAAIRRMANGESVFFRMNSIAGKLAENLGYQSSLAAGSKYLPDPAARVTFSASPSPKASCTGSDTAAAAAKPVVKAASIGLKAKSALLLRLLSVIAAVGIGMSMYFCYAPDADAEDTVPEEVNIYDSEIHEPEEIPPEEITEETEEEPNPEPDEEIIAEESEEEWIPEVEEEAEQEVAAAPEEKTYYNGDLIDFGSYRQGGNGSAGKQPILWRVLDIQDNHALLISVYGLDICQYNYKFSATWETSQIRSWLNGSFLRNAFTKEELKAILKTEIDNGPSQQSPYYTTSGGADTEDRVFLLSYGEVVKYFENDDERICMPTDYADSKGALVDQVRGSTQWWLRTRISGTSAAFVSTAGNPDKIEYTDARDIAVRPCIWVDLDADILKYA